MAGETPEQGGRLHQVGFVAACLAGAALVAAVDGKRLAAAVAFAASAAAMLGASALYHRITWSARVRPWMRRLDHAGRAERHAELRRRGHSAR